MATVLASPGADAAEGAATTLVTHVLLLDGSGAPGRLGSLRIAGDRIAGVAYAPETLAALPGETAIDAHGLALAPGFIDTHTHGDEQIREIPDALAAVSQGITTLIGGQDGGSELPLAEFFARLERQPAAVNIASYAGHGSLRSKVLGADFRRAATAAEIAAMRGLLRVEMDAGALGLSTGLEYDPGIYSTTEELVELAKVAAAAGGRYISHVRSEDRDFWAAIAEILAIGREARLPVQISHIKLAMRSLWGQASRLLTLLDEARRSGVEVTADIYPYLYWHAGLTVLFPQRNFDSLEAAEFALREVVPPEGLIVARYLPEPSYAGRTLAAIAKERGEPPARTLIELIRMAEALKAQGKEGVENIIATSMVEGDLEQLLAWPETNL
ncbi:MAG: amidohydrolase family protein, partial [Thermoanaerobaculia bacterium]